ncbi:hypothetical protein CsSME_00053845 [Camellia sinensis var. sinensis]
MWSVWKSRTECLFNKAQPDWNALEDLIKAAAVLWMFLLQWWSDGGSVESERLYIIGLV